MGLEYVDIFYHHRPDPAHRWRIPCGRWIIWFAGGKRLPVYQSHPLEQVRVRLLILNEISASPCSIHQPKYSMFERWVEEGLLAMLQAEGGKY